VISKTQLIPKTEAARGFRLSIAALGVVVAAACGDDTGAETDDTTADDVADDANDTDADDTGTDDANDTDADDEDKPADDEDDEAAADDDPADDDPSDDDPADDDPSDPDAGTEAPMGEDGGAEGGETPTEFAPITALMDDVLIGVNDLRAITYASNGKIYASGFTDVNPLDRQIAIVRLNANGTLDDTFADEGIFVHNLVVGDEQSLGIVELANGDLVVQANVSDGQGGAPLTDIAGGASTPRPHGQDVVLARFTVQGQLVESFGDDGVALLNFGWLPSEDATFPVPTYDSSKVGNARFSGPGFPSDNAWDLQLDNSAGVEKLVVFGAGSAKKGSLSGTIPRYDSDRYILRVLASNGAPDSSFNGNGDPFTFNTLGAFADNARRGYVEADGSIVSAGYTNFGPGFENHIVVLRLDPDGTLDPEFGFGIPAAGATRFNPFIDDGGAAECYAVGQQSNGRYVSTGYGRATGAAQVSKYGYATSDDTDLVSFGFTATGIDPTFGIQGTVAIQSEEAALADTEDRGRDLVILADDRIVQVGRYGGFPAIFVLTPDGQLDTTVGEEGRILYDPIDEETSHFFKVALSPDGTRVVATTSNHPDGVLIAILQVGDE
jgi:uncharacterized delta-60 repeat protein